MSLAVELLVDAIQAERAAERCRIRYSRHVARIVAGEQTTGSHRLTRALRALRLTRAPAVAAPSARRV